MADSADAGTHDAGTHDAGTNHAGPHDGAMQVTGTAQHEAWWAKTAPPVERVADGVWSIPVPAADLPIRYTLSYLFQGADGAALVVDPGWDTDAGWDVLLAGWALAGSAPTDVTGILITHGHPDHHGLTARLAAAAPDAWVGMHPDEMTFRPVDHPQNGLDDHGWLTARGVPGDVAAEITLDQAAIRRFAQMPAPTRVIKDGDPVPLAGRALRAIWTPGHTPGHLCLHDEDLDLLLTGDHVLPRISPNVGLQAHTARPPLGPYLDSLNKLRGYDSAEVLPAHEWRFRGLAARIDVLIEHHAQRCAEVESVLAERGRSSAWQVTGLLTWSRGWAQIQGMQRRAALTETAAHLTYLVDAGRVAESIDGDGVLRYDLA